MSHTALLLLDFQQELTTPAGKFGGGGFAETIARQKILENAAKVLTKARERNLTIVHVRLLFQSHYQDGTSVAPRIQKLKAAGAFLQGTAGVDFDPAVAPLDAEIVINKQAVNPFFNTPLLNLLCNAGVKRVLLCGIATNMVVEAAARYADDAGFEVIVLSDCCTSRDPEAHEYVLRKVIPVHGTVSTSDTVIEALG